jgi:aspartate-semialdehyde dehydrogenase
MHAHRRTQKSTIAIVGGESLLGKEIRDLLESSGLPAVVKLIAADEKEETAIISRIHDEPVLINSLLMADLGTAQVVVLAGPPQSSQKAYQQILSSGSTPAVIDLNGGLEDHPATRLRAPMVEPPGFKATGAIQVIAHPAAIALALFLTQLRKAGAIRRSVVEVFEPMSERGQAGIEELQKQTAGLLLFKPLVKDVFDAQVSFNMLAQYGSESPHSLQDIELKIDRHLASLLAVSGAVPMPSLRLIQAPVFHGYSISVWVEFDDQPGAEGIMQSLASNKNNDVRATGQEPPNNVGVAGLGGITVGAIAPDRNHPRACWFWLAADNLRIAAENALEVARESIN